MTTADLARWQADGFALLRNVVAAGDCARLSHEVDAAFAGSVGARNPLAHAWCRDLAPRLAAHPALRPLLPDGHVATQCTYFSKSTSRNWLVALHQDLGIPVAARVDDARLSGWSRKDGVVHVQPPADVLEALVAVRVHLDDCGDADGPLRVVPGSHRHGRLAPDDENRLRDAHGLATCTARRGDALVMRPLLLHASSKASGPSRRRVLHYVFGPRELPWGLRWHDIV
ncbi:phytanoyl-CoA dioxygenase family protein [Tahibacter soli]|uniref:Phytanoyl-CoA dioxygenase family protein n=1 Tax=Tahibacter soli TaxID=2983605 RepID=A0A9X3YKQ2_9GAMM|nr:phytanoyl-CoA dioxygenase family protein [Tahibacter soli]MDC8012468.1 phytanoyl-CoA dioxygenase family protein [Tahibacter soli]